MGWIFLIIALLCGIVLIIEMPTGSLQPAQVAGIGILSLCIGVVAPRTWPPTS